MAFYNHEIHITPHIECSNISTINTEHSPHLVKKKKTLKTRSTHSNKYPQTAFYLTFLTAKHFTYIEKEKKSYAQLSFSI